MRNTAKILSVLLCAAMLLGFGACGNKGGTESTKETSAVTDTTGSEEVTTGSSGDIDLGDGVILPEDGRIVFGENNNNENETAKAASGDKSAPSGQGNTASGGAEATAKTPEGGNPNGGTATTKSSSGGAATTAKANEGGNLSGGTTTTKPSGGEKTTGSSATTAKTGEGEETTGSNNPTSSSGGSASDDKGWGDIQWNG